MPVVTMVPKRVDLLTAASTGASQPIDILGYTNVTLYFKTNGSPGAGTVVIEEADWGPTQTPTGLTWSLIDTVVTTSDVGNSSQYAYHVGGPGGSYSFKWIRVRITVTVTTATLDVVLVAV